MKKEEKRFNFYIMVEKYPPNVIKICLRLLAEHSIEHFYGLGISQNGNKRKTQYRFLLTHYISLNYVRH